MEKNEMTKIVVEKYVEAETVSEDSESSSLGNSTDAVSEVNPFFEGIKKIKGLIQELEGSFRKSNDLGSNLILRCVLLRAENQDLVHKIDEKNRNLSTVFYGKQWQLSVLSQKKLKTLGNDSKRLLCPIQSKTSLHRPIVLRSIDEVDVLHKTISDLQKKLRERDHKLESLCQKYLHLKTNKNKMENNLRSEILNLKKQLQLTSNFLTEFQNELEVLAERSLSQTKNTYEALFLQEKLRCSKLMYEKIKLHHEIKRLEEVIRKQSVALKDESECWKVSKSSVDKSTSEPFMRRVIK